MICRRFAEIGRWGPAWKGCAAWAVLAAVLAAGCGGDGGPGRYRVRGTVTFDGKPVPLGYISFAPDTSQGNRGPGSGAPIRDGSYETASGKGVVGGPYVVRIAGTDGVPVELPGEGMLPEGSPLFEEYVTKIVLAKERSEQDFEVPSAAP